MTIQYCLDMHTPFLKKEKMKYKTLEANLTKVKAEIKSYLNELGLN